jgi:hypothetical protein
MSAQSRSTTDHDEIRRWAEERGGKPATVEATVGGEDEAGILRIRFPGVGDDDALEDISWHSSRSSTRSASPSFQEETKEGGTSRFFKFVRRD